MLLIVFAYLWNKNTYHRGHQCSLQEKCLLYHHLCVNLVLYQLQNCVCIFLRIKKGHMLCDLRVMQTGHGSGSSKRPSSSHTSRTFGSLNQSSSKTLPNGHAYVTTVPTVTAGFTPGVQNMLSWIIPENLFDRVKGFTWFYKTYKFKLNISTGLNFLKLYIPVAPG